MKKHNMLKVSIIIPVYNVEKYITRCIQSLLDQIYENFEAIFVDDGSVDHSIEIAKQLVHNDARFIFLEKENGGQASARNLGLDHASGDYIAFLDSDDYFSPLFLKNTIMLFDKHCDADVVMCGYQQVGEHANILHQFMPNLSNFYSNHDVLLTSEAIDYNIWNKIYKKSLWHKHRFVEGIIYEDKEILPRLLYQKRVYLLEEYLCCYVQRDGSTMNTYHRGKSVTSILYIYDSYKKFLNGLQLFDTNKDYYLKSYIKFCFFNQLYMILAHSPQYKLDCQYLIANIDTKIVSLNNVRKYYGIASKQFVTLMLFKISPVLMKNVLNLKLGLQRLLKRSQ